MVICEPHLVIVFLISRSTRNKLVDGMQITIAFKVQPFLIIGIEVMRNLIVFV